MTLLFEIMHFTYLFPVYFYSFRTYNSFNRVVKVDTFETLHDQEYLYFILTIHFLKFPSFKTSCLLLLLKHFFSGSLDKFPLSSIFFSLILLSFFFFVSLGSVITHFIYLLPKHSASDAVSKRTYRHCSFSVAASVISRFLEWRARKGGDILGPAHSCTSPTLPDSQTTVLDTVLQLSAKAGLPLSLLTVVLLKAMSTQGNVEYTEKTPPGYSTHATHISSIPVAPSTKAPLFPLLPLA